MMPNVLQYPSTPSMRLMAFMMPTPATSDNGTLTTSGTSWTPQRPWKSLISTPNDRIITQTTTSSIRKRNEADISLISSHRPRRYITNSSAKMMIILGSGSMRYPIIMDIRNPMNTVVPPITGTGTRCNFRASGLSTILCFLAKRRTYGKTKVVTINATNIKPIDIPTVNIPPLNNCHCHALPLFPDPGTEVPKKESTFHQEKQPIWRGFLS